ncbi:UbiA prenyltransferase family [Hypoxylon crocopeplum]|nr:UbiA prenyltransferase family [Hypoxylon crocopeplum]
MFLTASALVCLYALPKACWVVSVPSITLLVLYPFAKRFTDFPQAILGVQVSLGFIMGMGAINSELFTDMGDIVDTWDGNRELWAIAAFYSANICWTIIYDTVYAQQDVEDDAKAGVRSMAVRFRGNTKTVLWASLIMQTSLLLMCGYWGDFGGRYMTVACGGTTTSLGFMIWTIDLTNPDECMWWFKNGCWLVGLSISAGLGLETLR